MALYSHVDTFTELNHSISFLLLASRFNLEQERRTSFSRSRKRLRECALQLLAEVKLKTYSRAMRDSCPTVKSCSIKILFIENCALSVIQYTLGFALI